jgi:hypothetical protein
LLTSLAFSNNFWGFFLEINRKIQTLADQLGYVYPDDHKTLSPLEFTGKKYEKKFKESIVEIQSNLNYSAVRLSDGKVHLFPLNDEFFFGDGDSIVFPEVLFGPGSICVSMEITPFFLIYISDQGVIFYIDLEELVEITQYRHNVTTY